VKSKLVRIDENAAKVLSFVKLVECKTGTRALSVIVNFYLKNRILSDLRQSEAYNIFNKRDEIL
jgi:hypothetical protein